MKVRDLLLLGLVAMGSGLTLLGCSTPSGGSAGASPPGSAARTGAIPSRGRTTLTGTVERVWEDGFRLNTGSGSVNVDAWDVHGDSTRSKVQVGSRVSVVGEMSGGEFDAASIAAMAR